MCLNNKKKQVQKISGHSDVDKLVNRKFHRVGSLTDY